MTSSMKRIFGNLKNPSSPPNTSDESPEAVVAREVSAFIQSGPPGNTNGTEFVHLPAIVENAESSPIAAKEAAYRIRKYLSSPASPSGYLKYNAIMLFRILIDNPGHTFTRNIDAKFVSTVKDLIRNGRDMGVQRFLRETLDALQLQRSWDEDLAQLLEMWKKEKTKLLGTATAWWPQPQPQPAQSRSSNTASSRGRALPPPEELAARISEAKTSAKLLLQFVQCTPPAEIPDNELIKEFFDRCRSAARSIQDYIHATDPQPDEDTLLTLIETNDELSVSLSKYQHSLLSARRAVGSSTPDSSSEATASGAVRPVPPPPMTTAAPAPAPQRDFNSPPSPVSTLSDREASLARFGSIVSHSTAGNNTAGRNEYRSEDFQVQNPFADSHAYNPHDNPAHGDQNPVSPVNDEWSSRVTRDLRNVSHKEV